MSTIPPVPPLKPTPGVQPERSLAEIAKEEDDNRLFRDLKARAVKDTPAEDPWAPQVNPRYVNKDGTKTSKGKMRDFLDNTPMTILMIFCTLWALFAVDITTLILPKSADRGMLIVLFIVFVLFLIEIPLECWIQGKNYFEFYFWLDTFTTLSLVPDLLLLFQDTSKNKVLDILTLARAGRAARASSRATRIIRFIKVLNSGDKVKSKKVKKEDLDFEVEEGEEVVSITQSLVGIKFTDATTRRVVFIVIMVLILLALLDLIVPTDWVTATAGLSGAVLQLASAHNQLVVVNNQPALFRTNNLEPFLAQFPSTVNLVLNSALVYQGLSPEQLRKYRTSEIEELSGCGLDPKADDRPTTECLTIFPNYDIDFNIRSFNRKQSGSNVLLVILIVIVLAVGNFFFIHKADQLVISPVERMTQIVRQLAVNPLMNIKDSKKKMQGESGVVLNMLRKLVGLVQTGFGEAGSAILAANMNEGGSVDVMKPGIKMRAIFGFCDIRNFTDMTEILNEDCMFLVNSIADILHGNVHARLGSANKNIGDAFLLVWRLHTAEVGKKYVPESTVAANAVNSFLHTMKDMSESTVLAVIGKRTPKYAPIKMGYGLHVGWGIEGAVGSHYKIDATYLSPHVNMSARLESLTKTYSAAILMSGEFYSLLPTGWQKRCRLVDIITVKGSSIPLELYVIDDQSPVETDMILFPPETTVAIPTVIHRQIHLDGVSAFRKGNWKQALAHLEDFYEKTQDPPTQLLITWIKEKQTAKGEAPSDFEGFRRLVEK